MGEDEAAAAAFPEPSAPPPPASLHPKHASMLERLSSRPPPSAAKSPSPVSSFLSSFAASKLSIESALLHHPPDSASPDLLRSHLALISSQISDLDSLLSLHSHLLTPFDLTQSLSSISHLRSSLQSLSSSLLPRRRFAFRQRPSAAAAPAAAPPPSSPPPPPPPPTLRDSPGFRGRAGETLARDFRASEGKEGEFTLEDLDSCEVHLRGTVRALFVHRVRQCRVYAGPVVGSMLVEEVEGSVFVVAAHQIRIHNVRGTDFYLRVRSRPIIEDCRDVRFGPYRLAYEGLEEDLEEAGLREDTGSWANVDDFLWLRAVQSPNWRLLGEEEREAMVDISGSEEIG